MNQKTSFLIVNNIGSENAQLDLLHYFNIKAELIPNQFWNA